MYLKGSLDYKLLRGRIGVLFMYVAVDVPKPQ